MASVLAITLFVLLLPPPVFAQSEKQRYEGLTDDSKLNDSTNQLVSYSSSAIMGSPQNNAHRLESLNATAQTSQPGAIIFLADGIDINAMIPNISGIPPETRKTDYLYDPINAMVKAMGIPNITIYHQFIWSGDPGQTWSDDPQKPNVLKNLKEQLVTQYNDAKALNEKFIVISHSWGAALTYWALSDLATTVKPDLYITLSSPLAPPSVFYFNQGFPTLITKDLVVSAYVSYWEFTLQNDKANHWIGEPNTVRHINYWAWGDPISGPMSSLKQGIEDVQVDSSTSTILGDFIRNLATLLHWHPFTGLADQDFLLQPTNNQQLKDMISNAIKQALQSSPIPPSITTTTAIVSTAPTYAVTTTSILTSQTPTTFTIPQLVAPNDGITLQINQNTTFRWSNTGATRYKFEAWNDTNKMNYSFDVNGTSTQFAPVSDGSWRWQVRSYSSNGQAGDAPYTRSFKVVSAPSQPSSGIALYDGPNFTGPFIVLTMGKYSNLADYSWSDRIESIRFLGDYSNNYHVVLYSEKDFSGDPGHYDADASTLGNAQQNHVRSVEIYRKTPGSGIELYDGQNFSGTCVFLPVAYPEGKYADLTTVGFWDRAESIKFVGDCVGGKAHAVLFSEKDFQGDPAHFDNDATILPNAQQNHVRSVTIYMHQPPSPPTNPNPASGTVLDKFSNSLDVTFNKDGDQFQIHVWGNNYDQWRNWDSAAGMHLDGLVPGQTYYWQAQGKNNIGVSPWSPQWSFTTAALPTPSAPPATTTMATVQTGVFFSSKDGPWSYMRVRLALDYAIDKQAICSVIGNRQMTPLDQFVTSDQPDYNPNIVRGYDPAKAYQLMQNLEIIGGMSAGYPNGFPTTLYYDSSDSASTIAATELKAYLAKVLIFVTLVPVSAPVYATNTDKNSCMVVSFTVGSDTLDAVNNYFSSSSTFVPQTVRPAGLDDLITQCNQATNSQIRNSLLQQIYGLIFGNEMYVPLWSVPYPATTTTTTKSTTATTVAKVPQ